MSSSAPSTNINSLAVLAYKIAPQMFDLSTGLVHVSLRDQIMRGNTLVRDLLASQLLAPNDELLVVGAGAAGIAAAQRAVEGNCTVTVIDTAAEPFGLQLGVTTRYVGPYMYEWPSDVHQDQHFAPLQTSPLRHWNPAAAPYKYSGLEFKSPHPVTADQVAKDWRAQLLSWEQAYAGRLVILTKVDPILSMREIKKWHAKYPSGINASLKFSGERRYAGSRDILTRTVAPKFIILAAGFGQERTTWKPPMPGLGVPSIPGAPFWQDDDLGKFQCGISSKPTMVVLGGGDGALQDTLRCLFTEPHPLGILKKLTSTAIVKSLFRASHASILLIEQQCAASHTWGTDRSERTEFQYLHNAYSAIARNLAAQPQVRSAVFGALRTDVKTVSLIVRDPWLGKAYSLNRFLILIIDECMKLGGAAGVPRFELRTEQEVSSATGSTGNWNLKIRTVPAGAMSTPIPDVDYLSIRFGVDGDKSPGQLMGLTKKDTMNRRELAKIAQGWWVIP
jgi:hypothetical protein